MKLHNTKGIIFDMDNTVLRSRIDFDLIKHEIFDYLVSIRILTADFPIGQHTSSSVIEYVQRLNMLTDEMMNEIWNISMSHELVGMQGADLEEGVIELLCKLKGKYTMVILTNNSFKAAEAALKENYIDHYFDHIIGREQVKMMKPASDGVYAAMNLCKIKPEEWISVGDAWVDGKASQEAGVKFISYQGDLNLMKEKGVQPFASINHIKELQNYL